MLNRYYPDQNRRLKENASRKRTNRPSRRRRMNEEYDKVLWVDYEGQYFDRLQDEGIINFGDVVEEVKNIVWGIAPEARVVTADYMDIEVRDLTQEEYDKLEDQLPKYLREWYKDLLDENDINIWESMRRKRSSRKRRMNEDFNMIPAPFRKYLQLSDYDDEDDFTVGDIVTDYDGNKYAIISYLEGTTDYEEVMRGENLFYILVQNLSNKNYYVAEYFYDENTPMVYPIDIDRLKLGVHEESMTRRRSPRKRCINEDSEERNCTFDVDYDGDYFSDLSSRGIIDFNDVLEKVQNILYFKYPEAYAVKVGYDEIEIRNLTKDDCEFIEDDIYWGLVNWYQDIEKYGNPNRWTESVCRKR